MFTLDKTTNYRFLGFILLHQRLLVGLQPIGLTAHLWYYVATGLLLLASFLSHYFYDQHKAAVIEMAKT